MRSLLLVLAMVGVLAVLRHAAIALWRARGRTAEDVAASQSAEVRARQGDLTGLAEASAWRTKAKRRRRGALLLCGLWLALLLVPPFTSFGTAIYAAYAALWLLPARRPG